MMLMKTLRTTITLDADVADKLKGEMRRTGDSFKDTVNAALRRGLTPARRKPEQKPFKVKPFGLGLPPGLSYDKVWELIEFVDGPFYR
jgi:hypothetical protein